MNRFFSGVHYILVRSAFGSYSGRADTMAG